MIDPRLRKYFKKDFLWGASVASHQVEGGTTNQWSAWEHANAARLAKSAKERLDWLPGWSEDNNSAKPLNEKLGWNPNWKDVAHLATDSHNYISGKGVDHFHKYALDFALASKIGLNAMRSGIEWSRITPDESGHSAAGIKHYNDYFAAMKRAGLEPFVNLWHWTNPQWFESRGGFAKAGWEKHWKQYVHTLAQNLDFTDITYVITINEANSYASLSYGAGEWPPAVKKPITSVLVYYRLAKAHRLAYKILKQRWPHLQVGVAHQLNTAIGHGFLGKATAVLQLWYWNWSWMKRAKHHDFVGFNFYFTDHRKGFSLIPNANPKKPLNDLGWYMNPAGIEKVIMDITKRYKNKPIIITENGVADMHDQYREWWLAETMQALARCIKKGANVHGYLHWSLLDNFEWAYGWWPKFGLIDVDRSTMKRTVKKSAIAWSKWLKGTNG
jgi:beta-glucosidase